jgi:NADH-quinone oxidoreductase subunit D
MEELTGTRFHTNYNLIGGARYDITPELAARARELADGFDRMLGELWSMTGASAVFRRRTVGIGVIPRELALGVGVTGPVLRGSGVRYDVRRVTPYDAYDELDFEIPVRDAGDAFARFEVRMAEIEQSARLARQLVDGLPAGPLFSRKPLKNPKATRLKEGETYAAVESPRGELGYYLVADGSAKPYRLKINAPSFDNLQVVPHIAPGMLLADVIATLGSLDPVLGDVDR